MDACCTDSTGDGNRGFRALDLAYRPRLRAYVGRFLCESEGVDDVVQETLFRAFCKGLHEDERDPWPWLAVVARNLAFDTMRVAHRRETVDLAGASGGLGPLSTDPGPELDALARRDVVRDALAGLTPRHRELLTAKYLEDRDYHSIASARHETFDAVQAALARARRAFAAAYRSVAGDETWVVVFVRALKRVQDRWRAARARLLPRRAVPAPDAPHVSGLLEALPRVGAVLVAVGSLLVGGDLADTTPEAPRRPSPPPAPAVVEPSPLPALAIHPAAAADPAGEPVEPTPARTSAVAAEPVPVAETPPPASWQTGVSTPGDSPVGAGVGVTGTEGDDSTSREAEVENQNDTGIAPHGLTEIDDETDCKGTVGNTLCALEESVPAALPSGA